MEGDYESSKDQTSRCTCRHVFAYHSFLLFLLPILCLLLYLVLSLYVLYRLWNLQFNVSFPYAAYHSSSIYIFPNKAPYLLICINNFIDCSTLLLYVSSLLLFVVMAISVLKYIKHKNQWYILFSKIFSFWKVYK